VDESSFDKILEAYCRCFYLDLNNYDLVISTKAPTYMVKHPNHVSYLLHTIRVFYNMFDVEFDLKDEEKMSIVLTGKDTPFINITYKRYQNHLQKHSNKLKKF